MSTLATQEPTHITRPLSILVPLIKEDLEKGKEASSRAGMPYYIAAGLKMLEAKPQMKHPNFKPWLKRNFDISYSQAQIYMKLADTVATETSSAADDFSSLKDFRRQNLGHDIPTSGGSIRPPSWKQDVQNNIEQARREAERLRKENLTRQQERQAEQKLALRLIDIGYKVLAKELHPDKGGSRDAMQRLGRVRDRLKQSV